MKKLELNQMENLQGGGWLGGFGCTIFIASMVAVTTVSAGAAIPVVAVVAGGLGGSACIIGLGTGK
jgi:nitrate reductase gamma subunit